MSDSAPPPPPKPPQIDVRRLSLAQLHALANRGSRRARKELDARMAAPPSAPRPLPPAAGIPPRSSMPQPSARAGLGNVPATPAAGAGDAEDPRIRQLQFLERQDSEASRARDLPQFIGLAMLCWGALLVFVGLVTLAHAGGAYYLAMGAATLVVGWLLLKSSTWAIYVQAVFVLLALGWAWAASHSIAGALAQAAPIWIAACWIPIPQVREPLG